MERREIHHSIPRTASAAIAAAVESARALELACKDSDGEERQSLYLTSVSDLSRSVGGELESLAGENAPSLGSALVSAALRAADLATLAACALQELPPQSTETYRAASAAHLASGAARSLDLAHRALEAASGEDYAEHDLRGAAWRASLAARQADEALQTEP